MQHQFPSKILEKLCRIADAIDSVIKTLEQLEQTRCIVGSDAAYRSIVNTKLTDLARREHGVDLDGVINFTGIAEKSARAAGLPNPSSDAYILLDLVLTRQPKTTDLSNLSKDYARSTVIASLVRHLKTKGLSFEQIMKDAKIQELRDRYSVREQTIKRYYLDDKAPNKEIDIERLWKPTGRSSLFENFDPKRGNFKGYLATVLRNEARDLKRQIDRETDALSKAIRLKEHPSRGTEGIDTERNLSFAIQPSQDVDANLMIEPFRTELRSRNPKYLDLVRLIHSLDLDPTKERDIPKLQKLLDIGTRSEFLEFRSDFVRDLRQVFERLDASESDARVLLKVAKLRPSLK